MTGRRFLVALLVIAALALAGRVAYVMLETRHQELDLSTGGRRSEVRRSFDELHYVGTAEQLADGNGFRRPPFFGPPDVEAADHPPLTGLALWPVAWVFDGRELAMRLTIAMLGTLVVVLVGLTARHLAGASWPVVVGLLVVAAFYGIPRSRIAGEASLVVLAAVGSSTTCLCYNAGMATPDELANWYAAAWNERDADERRRLLESACSPGIRFLQEGWEHEIVGIDALDRTIAEFQAGWPEGVDVRVELTTPVDSHHRFGRGGFVWIFGDDRGYGTDFAELGDDGRMKTIVVFGDPGPPPARPA